jgi:hypothetical protein
LVLPDMLVQLHSQVEVILGESLGFRRIGNPPVADGGISGAAHVPQHLGGVHAPLAVGLLAPGAGAVQREQVVTEQADGIAQGSWPHIGHRAFGGAVEGTMRWTAEDLV